jgi:hypothetical protein
MALLLGLLALVPTARAAEQDDMRLVGAHDLQARSAYQPVIHQQGGRLEQENLLYPQIDRLDMSPAWGGHTSFPVLGVRVPHWSPGVPGRTRDFVLLVSESLPRTKP